MLSEKISVEDAVCDPMKYFNRPEDVVLHTELSQAEKLKILEGWKDICQKQEIADYEGMRDGGEDLFCSLVKRQEIVDLMSKIRN